MGLWNRVVGVYRIEDVGGIELLAQACAGEDRAEMLAEAIERDGAVVYSRSDVPRTHPAIKDEITCRAFAELEVAKRNPGQREGSRRPALASLHFSFGSSLFYQRPRNTSPASRTTRVSVQPVETPPRQRARASTQLPTLRIQCRPLPPEIRRRDGDRAQIN